MAGIDKPNIAQKFWDTIGDRLASGLAGHERAYLETLFSDRFIIARTSFQKSEETAFEMAYWPTRDSVIRLARSAQS